MTVTVTVIEPVVPCPVFCESTQLVRECSCKVRHHVLVERQHVYIVFVLKLPVRKTVSNNPVMA
jgi:hypothetical protein